MTKLLTPMPLSPLTKTSDAITTSSTEITVDNIDAFPDPASGEDGSALLCAVDEFYSNDPAGFETITYIGRNTSTNKLTGVTRAVEGTAKAWAKGTQIACFMTAEHFKRIGEKIGDVEDEIAGMKPIIVDTETEDAWQWGMENGIVFLEKVVE